MDENKVFNEVNGMCYLFNSYKTTLEAYVKIQSDVDMHWCGEDEHMEYLRKQAEVALESYMKALHNLYFDGTRNIAKTYRCRKISTIFKKLTKDET